MAGQATVEMALAVMGFLLLVFGMIDAARGIYAVQGLTRAAEAIAQQTSLQYRATSSPVTSQNLVNGVVPGLTAPFQYGKSSSSMSFDMSEPTTVVDQLGYQELSNRNVYVCGAPDLTKPWVITVTVKTPFTPVSSFFIGGKTMQLSRSATVFTKDGTSGSNPGAVFESTCPSH